MTTISPLPVAAREHRFFVVMAIAIAVTVCLGFSLNAALGRVDYAVLPPVAHLHALAFATWVALYVTQTLLVAQGNLSLHRRLGWFASGLVAIMIGLGLIISAESIRQGFMPPFFDAAQFLMLNILGLASFTGLVTAAVLLRRRTAWHRRLMLAAAVIMTEPALGRLLPMPLLGPAMLWVLAGSSMLFLVVAALHDLRTRGSVHPAYGVGLAVHLAAAVLIFPLAASPVVQDFVAGLRAG